MRKNNYIAFLIVCFLVFFTGCKDQMLEDIKNGKIDVAPPVLKLADSALLAGDPQPEIFIKAPYYINAQTGKNTSTVRVDWRVSIESLKAASFHLYRSDDKGLSFQKIAEGLTSDSYIDSDVKPGIVYYYAVKVFEGKYRSSIYSSAVPGYLLSPVTNLKTGFYDSSEKISLSWDSSLGAKLYYVERAEVNSGNSENINYKRISRYLSSCSFDDYTSINNGSVIVGQKYFYRVIAVNLDNSKGNTEAEPSVEGLGATIAANAPAKIAGVEVLKAAFADRIVVRWSKPISQPDTYQVYRVDSPDGFFTDVHNTESFREAFFVDKLASAEFDKQFFYRVSMVNDEGDNGKLSDFNAADHSGYVLKNSEGITAQKMFYPACVRLSWKDNPQITGHVVLRAGPFDFKQLPADAIWSVYTEEGWKAEGSISDDSKVLIGNNFDDADVDLSKYYYYKIAAVNNYFRDSEVNKYGLLNPAIEESAENVREALAGISDFVTVEANKTGPPAPVLVCSQGDPDLPGKIKVEVKVDPLIKDHVVLKVYKRFYYGTLTDRPDVDRRFSVHDDFEINPVKVISPGSINSEGCYVFEDATNWKWTYDNFHNEVMKYYYYGITYNKYRDAAKKTINFDRVKGQYINKPPKGQPDFNFEEVVGVDYKVVACWDTDQEDWGESVSDIVTGAPGLTSDEFCDMSLFLMETAINKLWNLLYGGYHTGLSDIGDIKEHMNKSIVGKGRISGYATCKAVISGTSGSAVLTIKNHSDWVGAVLNSVIDIQVVAQENAPFNGVLNIDTSYYKGHIDVKNMMIESGIYRWGADGGTLTTVQVFDGKEFSADLEASKKVRGDTRIHFVSHPDYWPPSPETPIYYPLDK